MECVPSAKKSVRKTAQMRGERKRDEIRKEVKKSLNLEEQSLGQSKLADQSLGQSRLADQSIASSAGGKTSTPTTDRTLSHIMDIDASAIHAEASIQGERAESFLQYFHWIRIYYKVF